MLDWKELNLMFDGVPSKRSRRYNSRFKVVGNINVDNSVLVEKKEEIR